MGNDSERQLLKFDLMICRPHSGHWELCFTNGLGLAVRYAGCYGKPANLGLKNIRSCIDIPQLGGIDIFINK
jgi:hypothetical protein